VHTCSRTPAGLYTSPGSFALNVNGGTLLSNNLNVSDTAKISSNTTLFSSLNVSGFTILNYNNTMLSSFNNSGSTPLNDISIISSLNEFQDIQHPIILIRYYHPST
jgi:hypothetical protein